LPITLSVAPSAIVVRFHGLWTVIETQYFEFLPDDVDPREPETRCAEFPGWALWKELVRVAVIAPPGETGAFGPVTRARIKELETAGSVLGVTVHSFPMRDSVDVSKIFAKLVEQRAGQAIVVLPWFHRAQIMDLAARSRIPSVCVSRFWPRLGVSSLMGRVSPISGTARAS